MSFTRKDYMDKVCTHQEYYAQFVTEDIIQEVANRLGKWILASTDEHMNDIALPNWDAIGTHPDFRRANMTMHRLGDSLSMAGAVCIGKEAARQWRERFNTG